MIEIYYHIRLNCDVCGKRTGLGPVPEILAEAESDGWRMNQYAQSLGYHFYALTCSEEHEREWEQTYVEAGRLGNRRRLSLWNWFDLAGPHVRRTYWSGPEALQAAKGNYIHGMFGA